MITDEPTWENAPERIWTTGNTRTGSWNNESVARFGLPEVEYIRADILEELKTKVEVATQALEDITVDPTWGLEHETYMRCRAALRKLKEESET